MFLISEANWENIAFWYYYKATKMLQEARRDIQFAQITMFTADFVEMIQALLRYLASWSTDCAKFLLCTS